MVIFPIRIPDCDSPSPALLDLFLSSEISICCTVAFHPLGNSDPLTSHQTQKKMPCFMV